MYCCMLLNVPMLNHHVPVCTGIMMYWYIVLVYQETLWYIPVCTGTSMYIPQKYIRVCTGMYFSAAKVCTDLYYHSSILVASYKSRSVHTGTYRYIPTYTKCRGFHMGTPSPGLGRPGRDDSDGGCIMILARTGTVTVTVPY
jgi:hypothetical protein